MEEIMQFKYVGTLPIDFEKAFNGIVTVAEKIGRLKRADKPNRKIVFKTGMKMDVNSILYDIDIEPIGDNVALTFLVEPKLGSIYFPEVKSDKYFGLLIEEIEEEMKCRYNPDNTIFKVPFSASKSVGNFFQIDEKQSKFAIFPYGFLYRSGTPPLEQWTYNFDSLVSFELIEDGETITKGGLGTAVLGAMTFGSAGAIVGSVVGGKKSNGVCSQLEIKVVLDNMEKPVDYIVLLKKSTPRKSMTYKALKKQAFECLALLENILESNKRHIANTVINDTPSLEHASEADELLKFHELMEKGIISKEDFEKKKKQILGL